MWSHNSLTMTEVIHNSLNLYLTSPIHHHPKLHHHPKIHHHTKVLPSRATKWWRYCNNDWPKTLWAATMIIMEIVRIICTNYLGEQHAGFFSLSVCWHGEILNLRVLYVWVQSISQSCTLYSPFTTLLEKHSRVTVKGCLCGPLLTQSQSIVQYVSQL